MAANMTGVFASSKKGIIERKQDTVTNVYTLIPPNVKIEIQYTTRLFKKEKTNRQSINIWEIIIIIINVNPFPMLNAIHKAKVLAPITYAKNDAKKKLKKTRKNLKMNN
jgi:hypothetical protein